MKPNPPLFDSEDMLFFFIVALIAGILVWAGICWLDANLIGIAALGDQGGRVDW
jgi:hypothetical protein